MKNCHFSLVRLTWFQNRVTFKNIVKGIHDSVGDGIWETKCAWFAPESNANDFSVIKTEFHVFEASVWEDRFLTLKNIVSETNTFTLKLIKLLNIMIT